VVDPEVTRVAQFFATHALLLLGLGILAAAASIAAIVWAAHLAARFGPGAKREFATRANRVQEVQLVHRVISQAHRFVPSAYLALHLALGLVMAVALAVFATLAEEALAGGEMGAFDVAFARALHNARSPAWHRAFTVVSWFGTRDALAIATVAATAALLLRQQMLLALGFVTAQAGGGLLNRVLKETFERTRPEFADPMLAASSWSFPSGHAMGTFILCGMVCYLLVRENRSRTTAAVILTGSALWCVVMAFSRLYLGVHYASDVLAGLLCGVAWVAVCVSALEVLRRRQHPAGAPRV
jgi:membrane-associated phospholipid phosphatase